MLKLIAVFTAIALSALAQDAPKPEPPKPDAPKPAEAAKPEPSPESKQFQAALQEKDPGKKAAALEKFLKEYPRSPTAGYARREAVTALVSVSPERASNWVKKQGKGLAGVDRAQFFRQYANTLLNEKKNLKDAEKYAARALKQFTWGAYKAAAQKRAKEAKEEVEADDRLKREYDSAAAQMRTTLAQVYLARNKTEKAAPLLGDAVKLDPAAPDAVEALGELAAKSGKPDEALKWYTQAVLTRPRSANKIKFAAAYEKVKGSSAGIDDYLDAEYVKLFPPAHTEPYQKTSSRSQRVVLAEIYTGAGCPPCVAADVAFDGVLERYKRDDVVVVMYHEHIPRPDPLTNSDTVARWKWQKGRGVPTYGIDGEMMPGGGGSRSTARNIEKRLRERIEKRLDTAPDGSLEIKAAKNGDKVTVTAKAGGVTSKQATLHLLLLEKVVRYSGENGIRFHPMVVRSIATIELKDGAATHTHEFTKATVNAALKKHADEFEQHDDRHNKDGKFRFAERRDMVNWSNIAVAAFVQDMEKSAVLQAAWSDVGRGN